MAEKVYDDGGLALAHVGSDAYCEIGGLPSDHDDCDHSTPDCPHTPNEIRGEYA